MRARSRRRAPVVSDRTLSRLTRFGVLVLLIGAPLFGLFYYMDRRVDAGPSLAERQVSAAEALVRKSPENVTYRLGLASAYTAAGRSDRALAQYEEILRVEPEHRVALMGRGDLLRERGDLAAAAAAYQKLIGPASKGEFAAADSILEAAYFGLATVRLGEEKPKEAMSTIEKALKIDATDADAWSLLGSAALRGGSPARAAEAFKEAVRFVPMGWCEPYQGMASAYEALKQAPAAAYATAMADFCRGDRDGARERLAGLTSGPAALDAMVGLAMFAEAASDRVAAAEWYRKALQKDPHNFAATTGLARLDPSASGSGGSPTHGAGAGGGK